MVTIIFTDQIASSQVHMSAILTLEKTEQLNYAAQLGQVKGKPVTWGHETQKQ
jgi:hypothetical protein